MSEHTPLRIFLSMKTCKCSIDACDEPSTILSQKLVTSRKEYTCKECGATIYRGDKYERVAGISDSEFFTITTCALCVEVRDCFCCTYYYGRVWEHIRDEAEYINLHSLDLISAEARTLFLELIDQEALDGKTD